MKRQTQAKFVPKKVCQGRPADGSRGKLADANTDAESADDFFEQNLTRMLLLEPLADVVRWLEARSKLRRHCGNLPPAIGLLALPSGLITQDHLTALCEEIGIQIHFDHPAVPENETALQVRVFDDVPLNTALIERWKLQRRAAPGESSGGHVWLVCSPNVEDAARLFPHAVVFRFGCDQLSQLICQRYRDPEGKLLSIDPLMMPSLTGLDYTGVLYATDLIAARSIDASGEEIDWADFQMVCLAGMLQPSHLRIPNNNADLLALANDLFTGWLIQRKGLSCSHPGGFDLAIASFGPLMASRHHVHFDFEATEPGCLRWCAMSQPVLNVEHAGRLLTLVNHQNAENQGFSASLGGKPTDKGELFLQLCGTLWTPPEATRQWLKEKLEAIGEKVFEFWQQHVLILLQSVEGDIE